VRGVRPKIGSFREKNLSIPAAAVFFSLDASSGLLATASASAPARFLALRSDVVVLYEMRDVKKKKKKKKGGGGGGEKRGQQKKKKKTKIWISF